MPYDMVERSMSFFGEEVVPRIRHVLTPAVTVDRSAAERPTGWRDPPATC